MTVPMTWGVRFATDDHYRFANGIQHLLENSGFRVLESGPIPGLFSYFGSHLAELIVVRLVFPFCDRIGFRRGRARVAALVILPLNLLLLPLSWLDRFDNLNPIGWAVLAEKVPLAAVEQR